MVIYCNKHNNNNNNNGNIALWENKNLIIPVNKI